MAQKIDGEKTMFPETSPEKRRPKKSICIFSGEVAERPIVQHWKCCVRETGPRVRIPPSPLFYLRSVVLMKRLIFTLRSLKKSDAAAEAPKNGVLKAYRTKSRLTVYAVIGEPTLCSSATCDKIPVLKVGRCDSRQIECCHIHVFLSRAAVVDHDSVVGRQPSTLFELDRGPDAGC